MTRQCLHYGHNGHNSRMCPNQDRGGVKLFSVRLMDGPIRKSASLGNLLMINNNPPSPSPSPSASTSHATDPAGYLSNSLLHPSTSSNCRERKKGVPWIEEEHRIFFLGLRKLGKGDWRGISQNFVITRISTQAASHAHKYFIRQSNMTRRKRCSSLFDMITKGDHDNELEVYSMVTPVDPICDGSAQNQLLPSDQNSILKQDPNFEHNDLGLLSSRSASYQENAIVDSTNSIEVQNHFPQGSVQMACIPLTFPTFVGQSLPIPVPFWPVFKPNPNELSPNSNIFKPRAEIPKAPVNIDELTSISQLSIGEPAGSIEPSALSLKLLSKPSRKSTFHTNPSLNNSSLSSSLNPIHVV